MSESLYYHLTDINKFDINNIDVNQDNLNKNKTIYNIYNNTISEPLHNFWFLLNYCKFIKNYDDKKLYFALNNKYMEHIKILDYLKNILIYIQQICEKKFQDEKFVFKNSNEKHFNYPSMICFTINDETNFTNGNGDIITLKDIKNDNSINYSILFEINYFFIKDNVITLNLNIITLQQKNVDKKKFLFLNENNFYQKKTIHNNENHFLIETKNNSSTEIESKNEKKTFFQIDSNILMQKIGNLKKHNENNMKENKKSNPGDAYLEQKKKLKNLSPTNFENDEKINEIIPLDNQESQNNNENDKEEKKEKKEKKNKKEKKDKKEKKEKKEKKDKKDKKIIN